MDLPAEAGAIVGYGRIVRDDEGNVVDIILPEESGVGDGEKGGEGDEDEGMELDGGGRKEEEEEEGVRRVEGKTDVVRCEFSSYSLISFSPPTCDPRATPRSNPAFQ